MAREKVNNVRLGLFVAIGFALLVIFIYSIGERQNLFRASFELTSVFKNVNGLQKGNNVRYSGINIGTVQGIEFISDSLLLVRMNLDDDVRGIIKKNAIATIGSDGLVGNMLVNITPGEGVAEPAGDLDELVSYSRVDPDELLNTLGSTNDNIALISNDLLKITQAITEGDGIISQLIYNEDLSKKLNRVLDEIEVTALNLSRTTREFSDLAQEVNKSQGLMHQLLHDTSIMADMRSFTTDLKDLPFDSVAAFIDQLDQAGTQFTTLAAEMEALTADFRSGEGVVAALLSDSSARADLIEIFENIREGSTRFNENMEALKSNFLFRRYFRRQARQLRKDSLQSLRQGN